MGEKKFKSPDGKLYSKEEIIKVFQKSGDVSIPCTPPSNLVTKAMEGQGNPEGVKVGDFYEDCSYEPMQCVEVHTSWHLVDESWLREEYGGIPGFIVWVDGLPFQACGTCLVGKSLVNEEKARAECSAKYCGVRKLTCNEAIRMVTEGNNEYPGGPKESHWLKTT